MSSAEHVVRPLDPEQCDLGGLCVGEPQVSLELSSLAGPAPPVRSPWVFCLEDEGWPGAWGQGKKTRNY